MQRFLIFLFTVVVFAAGYGTRTWTERNQPLPAPPAPGAEFAPKDVARGGPPRPDDRADLVARIQKSLADITAYQARLEAIDAEYQKGFVELLTPGQRAKYDERNKRFAEGAQRMAADTGLLSAEDIDRLRRIPLMGALNRISVASTADNLADEYKLDTVQKSRTQQLLASRRQKFLDLIDATPAPSIRLSSLAPVVSRLGQPGADKKADAKPPGAGNKP
jgi:hypothetical protein